jgi:hypothetical protein
MMNNENEFDELLERALARYSNTEPLAGLEDRVLQRIEAQRRVSMGLGRLRWALGIACFVILLALVMATQVKHGTSIQEVVQNGPDIKRVPESRDTTAKTQLPGVVPHHAFVPVANVQQRKTTRAFRTQLPKEEEFPGRTPLTPEEKALLSFVSRAPDQAVKALAPSQQDAATPLAIAPIQIEPLSINDRTEP